jgi:hypothetical protein
MSMFETSADKLGTRCFHVLGKYGVTDRINDCVKRLKYVITPYSRAVDSRPTVTQIRLTSPQISPYTSSPVHFQKGDFVYQPQPKRDTRRGIFEVSSNWKDSSSKKRSRSTYFYISRSQEVLESMSSKKNYQVYLPNDIFIPRMTSGIGSTVLDVKFRQSHPSISRRQPKSRLGV